MSHDTPPYPSPSGPTPEEISARLEALLKRTQAMRQASTSRSPGPQTDEDSGSWPPSDTDMAAVEVLDVPTPERPDWSTLRLRASPPPPPPSTTPRWAWVTIGLLAAALCGETAYLVWTAPWATAAPAATAPAPAATDALASDDTTVSTPPAAPAEMEVEAPDVVAEPFEAPVPPPTDMAPSAVTDTTGAVLIESAPPGAVVTMEGRERGVTPLTIGRLRPGRHDVLVVGTQGARAFKVDIVAGRTARLDASPGRASGVQP